MATLALKNWQIISQLQRRCATRDKVVGRCHAATLPLCNFATFYYA